MCPLICNLIWCSITASNIHVKGDDKKKVENKKWFEEDMVAPEYEPDVWVPIGVEKLSDDDESHVMVEDTYDIYALPGPKPDNSADTTVRPI